jgi:hypothetical protein
LCIHLHPALMLSAPRAPTSRTTLPLTISRPWRIAWFLFFAAGLNYADRTALSSVIPPLRDDIGDHGQGSRRRRPACFFGATHSPPRSPGTSPTAIPVPSWCMWSLVAWSLVTVVTGFSQSVRCFCSPRRTWSRGDASTFPPPGALLVDHHGPATRGQKRPACTCWGSILGLVTGGALRRLSRRALRLASRVLGFWVEFGLLLAALSRFFLRDPSTAPAPSDFQPRRRIRIERSFAKRGRIAFGCRPSLPARQRDGVRGRVVDIPVLAAPFLHGKLRHAARIGRSRGVALYKAPVFIGIAIGGWLSRQDSRPQCPRPRPRQRALLHRERTVPFLLHRRTELHVYTRP